MSNAPSRRMLGGIIAVLAVVTACGGDSATRVTTTPVPSAVGIVSSVQTAEVGTALAAPVQVRVTDASGAAVGGATVSWSPSAGAVTVATSTTNASGVAQTYWTLGTAAGAQQLTATVSGGSGIAPVVIQATATPGPSTGITIAPQALVVGQLDSIGLTITVKPDRYGNAVAGTPTISIADSVTADVRSGRVVAGRAGRTTITVSAGGVTGSATVRVTPIWRAIGAGYAQSCALDALGYAFCWGDNRYSALGRTGITYDSIPVPVSGALRFASLTVGRGHTCGLTAAGQAYCWGSNTARELGAGTTSDSIATPTAVAGGHTFTALSARGPFTCGIVTGGAAYCWGWQGEGELGNGSSGSFNPQPTPVAVNGGLTFASITAGGSHTCGMTTTNVSYCWGNDYEGEVGDASPGGYYRTSPTAVAGPTAFTRVFAGEAHSCGLDASGSTWCWGSSYSGQAGDAGFAPRYAPVQVSTPSPFVSLGLGAGHSCGLTAAGDVYCWGLNASGQLGDATALTKVNVVRVVTTEHFTAIAAGYAHNCALTADGRAFCWGDDHIGQLGNGAFGMSTTPVPVLAP
jgi:alpha-tubulin suppressor-like RCC1 family protein